MVVTGGDFKGQTVTVVGCGGHAFNSVYRVIVRTEAGELVWYWPWNLGELPG